METQTKTDIKRINKRLEEQYKETQRILNEQETNKFIKMIREKYPINEDSLKEVLKE